MSETAEHWAFHFFKLMASLAELFVFIYMGLSVFLLDQSWSNTGYFVCTLVACLIGRALHVYPGSMAINQYRAKAHPERVITPSFMHMLWWSGLRGAVAFALAIVTMEELDHSSGTVILSTTALMVLFTVLVFGGSTFTMLSKLKLRASDFHPSSGAGSGNEFKKGKFDFDTLFNQKWVHGLCNPVFVEEARKREAEHEHGHTHDHPTGVEMAAAPNGHAPVGGAAAPPPASH